MPAFSKAANKRIRAAVLKSEATPRSHAGSKRRRPIDRRGDGFWAKITGSLLIGGATTRWKYAWTEQARTATGFADLAGGRSGTTAAGFAINAIEANNTGGGIEGNSIDLSGTDFPAGFALKEVRGDPVVWMIPSYDDTGAIAYTFAYINAVDGTCEAA